MRLVACVATRHAQAAFDGNSPDDTYSSDRNIALNRTTGDWETVARDLWTSRTVEVTCGLGRGARG